MVAVVSAAAAADLRVYAATLVDRTVMRTTKGKATNCRNFGRGLGGGDDYFRDVCAISGAQAVGIDLWRSSQKRYQ